MNADNNDSGPRIARMNADNGNNKTRKSAHHGIVETRAPLLHGSVTERVLGVFYDVYNELGGGFLESVYGEAMAIALEEAGLPFQKEPTIGVQFRQRIIGTFRPDFIVARAVIVELKGVRALEDAHQAQLLNYLRASAFEVGLLLNFGPTPTYKRLAFTNARKTRVHPR